MGDAGTAPETACMTPDQCFDEMAVALGVPKDTGYIDLLAMVKELKKDKMKFAEKVVVEEIKPQMDKLKEENKELKEENNQLKKKFEVLNSVQEAFRKQLREEMNILVSGDEKKLKEAEEEE